MTTMAVARLPRRLALTGAAALVAAGLVPVAQAATTSSPRDLRIEIVSGRADLISGGDALVRVVVPKGVRPQDVAVDIPMCEDRPECGDDITSRFHRTKD